MNLLRRIFNINNLILLFALFALWFGIHQFMETRDGFDKLVAHKGIISEKSLSKKYFDRRNSITKSDEQDSTDICSFRVLDDPTDYTASWYAKGVYNLLETGDSVLFYTKPVTSDLGNTITNGKGREWNSRSPNEVFQLQSNRYSSPLISYDEYLDEVKKMVWIGPVVSALLLGLYFYRRSGRKSPFVKETISYS